jgi:hypothetical protein
MGLQKVARDLAKTLIFDYIILGYFSLREQRLSHLAQLSCAPVS